MKIAGCIVCSSSNSSGRGRRAITVELRYACFVICVFVSKCVSR